MSTSYVRRIHSYHAQQELLEVVGDKTFNPVQPTYVPHGGNIPLAHCAVLYLESSEHMSY